LKTRTAVFFISFAVAASLSCTHVQRENTLAVPAPTLSPQRPVTLELPVQFHDLTFEEVHPGIYPVAIYRYRAGQVNYACVGTIFASGPTNWHVILPKHVFLKGSNSFEGAYAIRRLSPDDSFVGFVGPITPTKGVPIGVDIVVADIVSTETHISNFAEIAISKDTIFTIGDPAVLEKPLGYVRSIITGNRHAVLASYRPKTDPELLTNEQISPSAKYPFFLVEAPAMEGRSGAGFIDQHGRFFAHQGSLAMEAPELAIVINAIEFVLGRKPTSIILISGPISLGDLAR
jgi:hypothetical protein